MLFPFRLSPKFVGQLVCAQITIALVFFAHSAFSQEHSVFVLDKYAPSEAELSQWSEASEILSKFLAIPEFVGREATASDYEVRNTLEQECVGKAFSDCQAYIKSNRLDLLKAIPNNPLYWDQYWQLLQIPTFLDFSLDISEQMDGYQRVLEAASWWFYKDLAQEGRIDVDHALTIQKASRNWSTGYQSLLTRMYSLAMQGIIIDQLNFAMAQASRDRDLQQLNGLAQALQPPALSELSWGPVLWVEREYQARLSRAEWNNSQRAEGEMEAALLGALGQAEESVVRMMIETPELYFKTDGNVVAEHYIPISVKGWDDYWLNGIPQIRDQDFGKFSMAAISAPAYANYIASERGTHFRMFLFPAIADVYAGRASPGIPARPAPKHWRWEWVDGAQPELCLTSDRTHPTTRQVRPDAEARWCVNYYDEAVVERLFVN